MDTWFDWAKRHLARWKRRQQAAKEYYDEHFTPRAQQVLVVAREEADRLNHNFLGTEHVLLGILKLGQGTAVTVLQKSGLDLETVRQEVEKQAGRGPDQKRIGNIPYTPRTKQLLALALNEAKSLHHAFAGTGHILLGLMGEGNGVAARVLAMLGADAGRMRQEILQELDPNSEAGKVIRTAPGDVRPMDIKNLAEVPAFTTKDGSEIRELLAHRNSVIRNQSLAEARLPVGGATQEHYHPRAEEIYYITHGTGRMRIGEETREVRPGDAIAIPPGQKHKLWNTGAEPLRLLCCCAPAYEHDDTIITEP
jgi:mannose-6-phosphate isomerase-like protein (cupin superfamily)